MIEVRKILHTEDYDDMVDYFQYEGMLDELKAELQFPLSRSTRYSFYYKDSLDNWIQITKN